MPPLSRSVRLLSRLIPAPYRHEVLADLLERHHGPGLALAILRSARDARRQLRTGADGAWRHTIGPDLRSAWRVHRARPAAACAVMAILAMAIGLNTSVSSMVDAVLLRPLPFADADRVQFLWTTSSSLDREPMAPARALDFRTRVTAFEGAALIGHVAMTVTGRGPADRWAGASVSSSFFDVLRSPALLGRTFTTNEPDRDVIVLSHRLWVEQFGADRSVVNRRLVMNGRPRTVVGVMPADFYWPSTTPDASAANPPLFWTCAPSPDVPEGPSANDEDIARNRTMGYVRLVARVRADRTVESARDESTHVAAALAAEYPRTDGGRGAVLVGARQQFFGPVAQPMWFVLLASGLVVLAACVNAGSLILVRQAGRRREFAVRAALGAGRARLARLLVIEIGILALPAGLAGAALAAGGMQLLVSFTPDSVGRLDQVTLNGRMLLWTLVVTAVTTALLGALAAMALWRDRSSDDLRGSGTAEPARSTLRKGLVAAEVALAVALLVGASLFGQSLWRLQHVDIGLEPDRLLTFEIGRSNLRAESQTAQVEFYEAVFDRLRAIPGVQAASGAVTLPIGGDDFGTAVFPEGKPLPPPGEQRRIGYQLVWDRWFDTLGMRVTAGRDFTRADTTDGQPVVVINQALAALEWPGEDPVGKRFRRSRAADAPWLTIVGVVSNILHEGPHAPPRPEIYLPYRQESMSMIAIALRTTGDPLAVVPAVRAAVADVDPLQPISAVSTMSSHLDKAYGRARFLSLLTILFAAAAGLLTIVGLYGVTSHAVTQRTREFGVRSALGASPWQLVRDVLRSSLVPVWIGLVFGLGLAIWTSRLVGALLFETAPAEPLAYVGSAGLLAGTALIASLIPARRAASIDPVRALRNE